MAALERSVGVRLARTTARAALRHLGARHSNRERVGNRDGGTNDRAHRDSRGQPRVVSRGSGQARAELALRATERRRRPTASKVGPHAPVRSLAHAHLQGGRALHAAAPVGNETDVDASARRFRLGAASRSVLLRRSASVLTRLDVRVHQARGHESHIVPARDVPRLRGTGRPAPGLDRRVRWHSVIARSVHWAASAEISELPRALE